MCYCHQVVKKNNRNHLIIFQHPKETHHALNTARIAKLSFKRCDLVVGEIPEETADAMLLIEKYEPLLLFPAENAHIVDCDPEFVQQQQHRSILVLDGSWRKAKRMLYESPVLQQLTCISYTVRRSNRYVIRKSPSATAQSTLEAIVQVLEIFEDKRGQYQDVLNCMDWVIRRQIRAMGQDVFQRNYKNQPDK